MKPVLAMLLASLLFASSNVGTKIALADLAIVEVVSGRFLFAAAVLWAMVLLTRQPVAWKEAQRPLLMGLLDPGLVSLLIVGGLHLTSAVNVAVFWALMPLFTPIAARLVLGEKINNLVILGALVAVTGAIILAMANKDAGEGNLSGDFLAICGVLCAVGTALLGRRVAQSQGRPTVTTAWQMTMALGVSGVVLLVLQQPGETLVQLQEGPIFLLAYLGMFALAGPFFLMNYALRHLPVGRMALFASLVGPLALPMAAIILGETIQLWEVAAITIVMVGVAIPSLVSRELLARFRS
jgi:drug/metabolite transporter (DMT)-like permease|tara:strand:+ start:80 stop:967 length:888 start_codon:yes stop_codon:yes gene_type:complete